MAKVRALRRVKAPKRVKDAKHKRVNDILLGPLERPALKWLSEHAPAWATPDFMTGVGIVGSLIIFASYCLTNLHPGFLWLASFGFFLNWLGDSLDGTIARYRHIERPKYGFYVDHVVDIFSQVLIFMGLGLSPYLRFEFAATTLIGYLMLSALVYIRTYVRGVFKISYGKLGPTEARMIAITANAVVFFVGKKDIINLFGAPLTFYDLVGIFCSLLLLIMFLSSAIHQLILLKDIDKQTESK